MLVRGRSAGGGKQELDDRNGETRGLWERWAAVKGRAGDAGYLSRFVGLGQMYGKAGRVGVSIKGAGGRSILSDQSDWWGRGYCLAGRSVRLQAYHG